MLRAVDSKLLQLLGCFALSDRTCAANAKRQLLAPGFCLPRNVPPELHVGRCLRKPFVGFSSSLLKDIPMLPFTPCQRFASSLARCCNRVEVYLRLRDAAHI